MDAETLSNTNISTIESNHQQLQQQNTYIILPDLTIKDKQRLSFIKRLKLHSRLVAAFTIHLLTKSQKQPQLVSPRYQDVEEYGLIRGLDQQIDVNARELSWISNSLVTAIETDSIEDKVHSIIIKHLVKLFDLNMSSVMEYHQCKKTTINLTFRLMELIQGKTEQQCPQVIEAYLTKCEEQMEMEIERNNREKLQKLLSSGKSESEPESARYNEPISKIIDWQQNELLKYIQTQKFDQERVEAPQQSDNDISEQSDAK